MELVLLGLGRPGHPGQLVIHAEVVLDGDGGERLRLSLHLHALLGLHRLVQPVAPPTAWHLTARELVDDNDLTVLAHDVLLILLEEGVRLQELVNDVDPLILLRILGLERADTLTALLGGDALVPFDSLERFGQIRNDKGLGVVR